MKKGLLTGFAALLVAFTAQANGTGPYVPPPVAAPALDEYVVGGFEASGHIFAGAGWQHFDANGGQSIGSTAAGVASIADINGNYPGIIGGYANTNGRVTGLSQEDMFNFFLDEVELDIAKTFGENIRVRADFGFGSLASYSGPRFRALGANVDVEQAYATANLALGNGVELLLGRFDSPLGFEQNDVINNNVISRSIIYRAFRPHSHTGFRAFYAFSDSFDWMLWAANNPLAHDTGDLVILATDVPSAGTRFNFTWGDEGQESNIALGGAWGQDHANRKSAWSFLGDLSFTWWATDNFAIGGEGIWRQVDTTTAGGLNGKYYGGLLDLHYDFSDVWDGTLRYSYGHDVNGLINAGVGVVPSVGGAAQSLTGVDQQLHEFALGGSYAISDGAKLKVEGGYTYIDPTGAANAQQVFGVAGGFAYAF